MTGIKVLAIGVASESAILVGGLDINALQKLGIVGILLAAVIVLWIDGTKRQAKFEAIMRESIDTMRSVRDQAQESTNAARQVVIVIEKCKGKV